MTEPRESESQQWICRDHDGRLWQVDGEPQWVASSREWLTPDPKPERMMNFRVLDHERYPDLQPGEKRRLSPAAPVQEGVNKGYGESDFASIADVLNGALREAGRGSVQIEGWTPDEIKGGIMQLLYEVNRRPPARRRPPAEPSRETLLQAVGLASTCVPDMVIDVADPIGMMQRVWAAFAALRSSPADTEGKK